MTMVRTKTSKNGFGRGSKRARGTTFFCRRATPLSEVTRGFDSLYRLAGGQAFVGHATR